MSNPFFDHPILNSLYEALPPSGSRRFACSRFCLTHLTAPTIRLYLFPRPSRIIHLRPGSPVAKEVGMRKREEGESWVIYQAVIKGLVCGPNAVCDQQEWEAMERARPGAQSLVQCGIATEGAAERLARGTSGDPKPRVPREIVK